jgi:hypothetical protein
MAAASEALSPEAEMAIRLVMAIMYVLLGAVGVQRLVYAFRCCPLNQPGRSFFVVLVLFAATRTVDMTTRALIPSLERTSEVAIVFSRCSISLFFTLCSQVVAQW